MATFGARGVTVQVRVSFQEEPIMLAYYNKESLTIVLPGLQTSLISPIKFR